MMGCCADKACTSETCMLLPEGKTCGDCVHCYRCTRIYGMHETDTACSFFPRKFLDKETWKRKETEKMDDVFSQDVTWNDHRWAHEKEKLRSSLVDQIKIAGIDNHVGIPDYVLAAAMIETLSAIRYAVQVEKRIEELKG